MHAIFQSLFGKRKVRSGPRERYGGDWDDVDDEEEESADQEEEVDESWIKSGINLTLFNSKAVDFACRCEHNTKAVRKSMAIPPIFVLGRSMLVPTV